MAEKDLEKFAGSDNKDILEKLNTLLDQNKTIARGLTLIHEKGFEAPSMSSNQEQSQEQGFQAYQPSMMNQQSNPQTMNPNRFKTLPKF